MVKVVEAQRSGHAVSFGCLLERLYLVEDHHRHTVTCKGVIAAGPGPRFLIVGEHPGLYPAFHDDPGAPYWLADARSRSSSR